MRENRDALSLLGALARDPGACSFRGSHAAFCLQPCCHNIRLRSRTWALSYQKVPTITTFCHALPPALFHSLAMLRLRVLVGRAFRYFSLLRLTYGSQFVNTTFDRECLVLRLVETLTLPERTDESHTWIVDFCPLLQDVNLDDDLLEED